MRANQELVVGQTRIAYVVVASSNARRSRIVIGGDGVRVIVPAGEDAVERAVRFITAKRRWVYRTSRDLPTRRRAERFLTGARVLFRGRRLRLTVAPSADDLSQVACRSRFDVSLPRTVWISDGRESAARDAVKQWLRQRLAEDGQELAARLAAQLSVEVPTVRVLPMKKLWASCGRDKVVRLHPDLVTLPRRLLEYVVAHEVAHLVYRNHSPQFWRVVRRLVLDYQACRSALDEHERRFLA